MRACSRNDLGPDQNDTASNTGRYAGYAPYSYALPLGEMNVANEAW